MKNKVFFAAILIISIVKSSSNCFY